jgi:hypothetical protein
VLREWEAAEANYSAADLADFKLIWNRQFISRVRDKLLSCGSRPASQQQLACLLEALHCRCRVPIHQSILKHECAVQVKQAPGVSGLHVMPFGNAGRDLTMQLISSGDL